MISKTVAAALLAAGCVTAAAGGAYIAVRQNDAAAAPLAVPAAATNPTATPAVSETEGVVTPASAEPALERAEPTPAAARVTPEPRRAMPRTVASTPSRRPIEPTRDDRRVDTPAAPATVASPSSVTPEAAVAPAVVPPTTEAGPPEPPAEPEPLFEEVVIPASSVIGLQVDTAVTSERAELEDRVDARVTRDVMANGRVAIPAGSRVIGAVTQVERGGKVKERARLGVRFHTLVLADGMQVPLRTETVLREGEPPSRESARKIGGAAVGGAILGAILGGGKGAVIGGATGAGAGTAAVMAGDRNAATLVSGSVLTVRLAAPVTIELERR